MSKSILLFDVDGTLTLTSARQKVTPEMSGIMSFQRMVWLVIRMGEKKLKQIVNFVLHLLNFGQVC
jgi:hypothetical protein